MIRQVGFFVCCLIMLAFMARAERGAYRQGQNDCKTAMNQEPVDGRTVNQKYSETFEELTERNGWCYMLVKTKSGKYFRVRVEQISEKLYNQNVKWCGDE